MGLSPDEKKIYINADTTAGEADGAMYFPVKYLTGLESTSNITATMYFRGPNNTTSTSVIVLITTGYIKEFYTQFVNEINFGDKAVITLAVRNLSVSTTQGGSDFVYVNAFAGAIVVNDDTSGYEDLQIAENLDVGGTITGDLTGDVTGTASIATTVTVADESTDTTCFPLFSTAATGNLAPKSGSNLTFNSSSGLLTATLLAGDLTGDVTGNADTATLAADATTLATPRAIFGHNFDGSAALTGVIASANLDADTAHLTTTQTFSGHKTFSANTALAGVIMDGNTITGVDDSGEFTDDDAHIMTSAGINDRFAQINADTTGNADTATLAADATTLATPRAIFGHDFDGSAALTGVIASANLDADTAHLSGSQSFTGLKTFSAGIAPSYIKHTISGNSAGDYGPGAEILFGISAETTTAGAIYVLRSGTWVLMDADAADTCRQLAAVAVGTDSSAHGMLIKGCVTLAADYTAGTDGEGTRVFASTTPGEATLTAPTASGDTVRVLGYSLYVSDQKMFFNPDSTHIEIA